MPAAISIAGCADGRYWQTPRGMKLGEKWLALQPVEMLRDSAYLRQVLYRELADWLRTRGYEPYKMNSKGFAVRGVEHLRERFSKRARPVRTLSDQLLGGRRVVRLAHHDGEARARGWNPDRLARRMSERARIGRVVGLHDRKERGEHQR